MKNKKLNLILGLICLILAVMAWSKDDKTSSTTLFVVGLANICIHSVNKGKKK